MVYLTLSLSLLIVGLYFARSKLQRVVSAVCKNIEWKNLISMESQQKYTKGSKVLLIDKEVVNVINSHSDYVADYLFESIERLNNVIEEDVSLGITFNDSYDKARFFEIHFNSINPWEIYLYDIEEVDSDRYLDLILKGDIVKTHSRKIRSIF